MEYLTTKILYPILLAVLVIELNTVKRVLSLRMERSDIFPVSVRSIGFQLLNISSKNRIGIFSENVKVEYEITK